MACTIVSRVLGFVRNAVIAALFGTTAHADVLNSVFSIPNNLRKLLAEGALSSAFIPILSRCLVNGTDETPAHDLVRKILTFLMIVLVPLMVLFTIFSRPIIGIFLDFSDPRLMTLSASLFRWICHYLFFISLSAVLMGVLNSHNIFVIPALTPVLFSVAVISSLLLFYPNLGIYSMAVGVLAGGLFQVVFQTIFYLRIGYSLKPDFDFRDPQFRRVLRLWLPVVATSSIFAVNQQIAMRFASGLEEGSTSALSYALVVWQLPIGVFSASITNVLFPRLSRQVARNDSKGLVETTTHGLRTLFLLLVPASLFYLIMGNEVVSVLYQRGEFSSINSLLTARVLFGYSLGLLSVGAYTFLQRFFYAFGDYRTPFFIAVGVTVLDVALSLWLKETPLRVVGLAVANSAAFSAGLAAMLVFVLRRIKHFDLGSIASTVGRGGVVLAAAGTGLFIYRNLLRDITQAGSYWTKVAVLMGGFCLFAGMTLVGYYAVKVSIVRELMFRRRRR